MARIPSVRRWLVCWRLDSGKEVHRCYVSAPTKLLARLVVPYHEGSTALRKVASDVPLNITVTPSRIGADVRRAFAALKEC
jgi:hypothetical protein